MRKINFIAPFVLSLVILVTFIGCGNVTGGGSGGGGGNVLLTVFSTDEGGGGFHPTYPGISVSGNNVYIGWGLCKSKKLLYTKSTDSGTTFSIITIEADDMLNGQIETAVSSSKVRMYYSANGSPGDYIALASTDATSGTKFDYGEFRSTAFSQKIYDLDKYSSSQFFAFSDSGGADLKYTSDILGIGTLKSGLMLVGVEDKTVVCKALTDSTFEVVYVNGFTTATYEVIFSITDDGGSHWHDSTIYDSGASSSNYYDYLEMDGSGNNVYVSFKNRDDSKLYLARSTDRGATWTTNEVSSTFFDCSTAIALSGSNLYIAFMKPKTLPATSSITEELCVAKSTDNGDTWTVKSIDDNVQNAGYGGPFGYNSCFLDMYLTGSKIYIAYTSSNGLQYARVSQ